MNATYAPMVSALTVDRDGNIYPVDQSSFRILFGLLVAQACCGSYTHFHTMFLQVEQFMLVPNNNAVYGRINKYFGLPDGLSPSKIAIVDSKEIRSV